MRFFQRINMQGANYSGGDGTESDALPQAPPPPRTNLS